MFNSNVQQLLLFQARKNVLKYSLKFWLPLDDLTTSAHVLKPTYAGYNQLEQWPECSSERLTCKLSANELMANANHRHK